MESLKKQHLSHTRDALRVHGHRSKRCCLQNFFLGPLFPAIVVATTKALPAYVHVFAIGFAAGVGGRGSAALPFGIGSLAQVKGIEVLQPVVLAVLAVLLVLWVLPEAREEERRGRWIAVARKWLNIDFDLVEVVRRTIGMARGG
jgi:hypothetical protein